MAGEKRINPETGVIEERHENLILPGDHWEAVKNENAREERVNPETGVIEERHDNLILPGDHWEPKRDD